MTELEALKAIDDALAALLDVGARKRVLTWAWDKFLPNTAATPAAADAIGAKNAKPKRLAKKKGVAQSKAQPVSLVKDLNLKPKDATSFDTMVAEKAPQSLYERCTLAVYYLKNEISAPAVSASHVYTCFKHMRWKLPTDLGNTLSYTASQHGWLDTSDMQDLKITAIGENLVEHDLPRATKKKS